MLAAGLSDLRYALRGLRHSPGFASAAILSLALGIGANTAIFTLIDGLILKSLPVPHPEQLVQVTMGMQNYSGYTNPTWEHLRDRQDVFSGIFAYSRWGFNLASGGEAHIVNGVYVSGGYFQTLGVQPALGRTLAPSDDTQGCAARAVLTYGFWQREFGGRADVLGKTILVDRHPAEITGVTQPGFRGTEVGGSADVMVPLCAIELIGSGYPHMLETNFYPVGFLQVIGRLKNGVSATQATARLEVLAPQIYQAALDERGLEREDGRQLGIEDRQRYLHRTFYAEPAANGLSHLRSEYQQALAILMAIVGVVLLIACANIANLLAARGAARQREMAIRMAVGSGRARLIRQLLTESLLLSASGTLLGMLLATWCSHALVRSLDASLDLTPDLRVFAFLTGVTVLAALLFGLAPAWRTTRVDLHSVMKQHAHGAREGTKLDAGRLLVTGQVALSLVLVVGAGLLLSTFHRLSSLDAGFDRNRVLLVTIDLRDGNYPRERWPALYQQILERLRAIPGVRSASLSSITPICHCRWASEVLVEGYTPTSRDDSLVSTNSVSDRYFETLGTSLLSGHDFDSRDQSASPKVAIISQSMAQRFFRTRSPLGKHFRIRDGDLTSGPMEIIGIVKDARYGSLRENPAPFVFLPWSQSGAAGPLTSFALRPAGGLPASLVPGAKSAIAEVNRDLGIQFQTLAARVEDSIARERLLAALSGFFGALALVLASIGLYGVTAYGVARRRSEIAIRSALGAHPSRILCMVLGEVAILTAAGLVIGATAALAATRLLSSFLYGVESSDHWTLSLAAALLALVATLAGSLPALRAARLSPMTALREE